MCKYRLMLNRCKGRTIPPPSDQITVIQYMDHVPHFVFITESSLKCWHPPVLLSINVARYILKHLAAFCLLTLPVLPTHLVFLCPMNAIFWLYSLIHNRRPLARFLSFALFTGAAWFSGGLNTIPIASLLIGHPL